MLKFLMYFAMAVGIIVIGAWISREANYFFNNLVYWIRYNWLPALGLIFVGIIAYKAFSK